MGVHRFLPGAVTLALVLGVVLGGTFISSERALGATTTITVIAPDVFVRHGADGVFVGAVDGEVARGGDAVRTGENGRAVLTYFEGSTVTIEPGTELAIDRADGAADGSTVVLMTQTFGRTWHVVTKLVTGGSRYEVRTPASTASVRGTEFEVLVDDRETTVTTTGGTVVDQVADPTQPGRVVDVPVVAGTTHTQPRNAPPTQPRPAPQPDRTVTVTVDASTSMVVDPLGRANGFTRAGTLVAQTPGARVKREGGKVVITLPDIPDGKLSTHVEDDEVDRVRVQTRIDGPGRRTVELDEDADLGGDRAGTTGVEIGSTESGGRGRVLDDDEADALPAPRVVERGAPMVSPTMTPRSPRVTRAPQPTKDGDRRSQPPSGRARASQTPRPGDAGDADER